IYAATAPAAEFDVPLDLPTGTHKLDMPPEFSAVDEIIAPTSYKALSADDPAFALFVVYPNAGLVEVLPQKWFTSSQYQVGPQWIPRAARITPYCRRMLWRREVLARGRWVPTGTVD